MGRFRLIALVAVFSMPAVMSGAHAQKRVALVVGNSAYEHTPKLANPRNDAADVAAALIKHGFQVIQGLDLDKPAFDRKVRDLAGALKGADAGVFFYAGHGLQVAGQNYLVPVDAKADGAEALEFEMVRVDVVHRIMERQTNTNILFLDACRDNPLARNLARSMGTRSSDVGRGLAAVESGIGTLISFSTQPGNVALDGTGRNSPFASALVKQLTLANNDLSAILIAVRNDVMRETQRKQVPWEHSALTGQFYFSPTTQMAEPAKVASARLSEAAEAWDRAKDATSVAVLEAFMVRFKDTFYADLARARVNELKTKQVAAISISPPSKGVWRGWHECSGIRVGTAAHINIDKAGQVTGTREFYPTEGDRTRALGSFRINGSYRSDNGEITLNAGEWITRPPGYGKCDFIGKMDTSKGRIVGNSPGCACGAFELTKQ